MQEDVPMAQETEAADTSNEQQQQQQQQQQVAAGKFRWKDHRELESIIVQQRRELGSLIPTGLDGGWQDLQRRVAAENLRVAAENEQRNLTGGDRIQDIIIPKNLTLKSYQLKFQRCVKEDGSNSSGRQSKRSRHEAAQLAAPPRSLPSQQQQQQDPGAWLALS